METYWSTVDAGALDSLREVTGCQPTGEKFVLHNRGLLERLRCGPQ